LSCFLFLDGALIAAPDLEMQPFDEPVRRRGRWLRAQRFTGSEYDVKTQKQIDFAIVVYAESVDVDALQVLAALRAIGHAQPS
jgi:hypothetical protein